MEGWEGKWRDYTASFSKPLLFLSERVHGQRLVSFYLYCMLCRMEYTRSLCIEAGWRDANACSRRINDVMMLGHR